MAKGITQFEHKGKVITLMDYTKCEKEELLDRIEEIKSWIVQQPVSSLLTLTDVTDRHFDGEILESFKKLATHNKPYVRAGGIIGIKGLSKIAYNTIMKFSGRKLQIFNTKEEALDWLSRQ